MKKLILLSFALFLGCNENGNFEELVQSEDASMGATQQELIPITSRKQQTPPEKERTSNKKLIKEGSIQINVENLNSAKQKVDDLVKLLNGYYDNENFQDFNYSIVYDLKVRIPVKNFDAFVTNLESGFQKITDKNISTKDVTSQFIDLESRLASKKLALARYRAILKNAKTVKEILEVEDYIRKIEEELESTAIRLKRLESQTSYSTLSIRLEQNRILNSSEESPSFWFEVKDSIKTGWNGIKNFVLILLSVWPFLIMIILAILGIRAYRKR